VNNYQYHTVPYDHQRKLCEISGEKKSYGFLMEMGTGKSKPIVDTSAHLFLTNKINGVLIVAPKGVHAKWLREDYPLSMPPAIRWIGAVWRSGDTKSETKCKQLIASTDQALKIMTVNVDVFSMSKSKGTQTVTKFLQTHNVLMVIDESTRIKNPASARTKNILKLGDLAKYRRILSGLPTPNSPFDLYSQITFLDKNIFGQSFFAFKHTYAEILPDTDPFVRKIMAKAGARFAPVIVATDPITKKPKYKNLDKLKELIAPLVFRITKKECLDLPDKIYETVEYDLEPKQRTVYDEMRTKARTQLSSGNVTVQHKMLLLMRLQQILSGYLPLDDGGITQLYDNPEDNPRLIALKDILEDIETQVIIWCRFKEEVKQIEKLLEGNCVTYYGETKDREKSEQLFKDGVVQYFIGTPGTGGIGLNLTNADTVIYYSNDFDLEHRAQSEDRTHRIGQKHSVVYIDLQAANSVDQYITMKLRNKEALATEVTDFREVL
jgi:SNF2 family DNA or RNA helicase